MLNFQKGEKMTTEEVNAIFSLLDINKDGKLDYSEVRLYISASIMSFLFLLSPFLVLIYNIY